MRWVPSSRPATFSASATSARRLRVGSAQRAIWGLVEEGQEVVAVDVALALAPARPQGAGDEVEDEAVLEDVAQQELRSPWSRAAIRAS